MTVNPAQHAGLTRKFGAAGPVTMLDSRAHLRQIHVLTDRAIDAVDAPVSLQRMLCDGRDASRERKGGRPCDWGQLWAHLLEPVDDVENLKYADPWGIAGIVFNNKDGKLTTVPMGHTAGAFFYRKDLVSEDQVPKTWDELVAISKKLQAENKVKFGYVGAMAMNATWFTWFWTMWTNQCDTFLPAFERQRQAGCQWVQVRSHRAVRH